MVPALLVVHAAARGRRLLAPAVGWACSAPWHAERCCVLCRHTLFPNVVPPVLPQNLSMESMHGSGAALHPLRGATALTRLRLAACHFESGALLGEALAGVVQPGGRGGAPGLKSLELEGCGVQSAVVAALTQALDGSDSQGSGSSSAIVFSPRERQALLLKELRVELKWRVGQNAGQGLAHAVAQCTQASARRHGTVVRRRLPAA